MSFYPCRTWREVESLQEHGVKFDTKAVYRTIVKMSANVSYGFFERETILGFYYRNFELLEKN